MALDPQLLDILVCPEDKGPLVYFADDGFLYNPRLKRKYEIRDDIPVLLVDQAETVSDSEATELDGRAEDPSVRTTGEG